ncbi:hypothetical protein CLU79DRAFT_209586 [Phycomyces nitens]|nr:hypothetical protein CLU79DRAFT_209586 [Phycomyces nitens]
MQDDDQCTHCDHASSANIKDNTSSLSGVGIHANSVVMLNGEEASEEDVQQVASGNAEEYGLIVRISGVLDKLVKSSDEKITVWEGDVTTAGTEKLDEEGIKKLHDMGNYLSEKLLQALITLDGVECPSEFETARQRRREGVRLTQQYLDRIDKTRLVIRTLSK